MINRIPSNEFVGDLRYYRKLFCNGFDDFRSPRWRSKGGFGVRFCSSSALRGGTDVGLEMGDLEEEEHEDHLLSRLPSAEQGRRLNG